MTLPPRLAAENGHTVLEGTVAMALLLTVLLPVVGMIAHTATHHAQRDRIVATSMAQNALEETLQRDAFADASWTSADTRWALTRTVEPSGRLAVVTIRVWRTRPRSTPNPETPPPLVELSATRFLPRSAL